jgi:hypothetical protein
MALSGRWIGRTAFTAGILLAAVLCLYAADLTQWLCETAPPQCEAGRPNATHISFTRISIAVWEMITNDHFTPRGLVIALPALAALAIARSVILRGAILALFFVYPAAPVLSYSQFYSCNHGTCEDALGAYAIGQNALYSLGAVLSLAYIAYSAYRKSLSRHDQL